MHCGSSSNASDKAAEPVLDILQDLRVNLLD
jgi:hypothetical protein